MDLFPAIDLQNGQCVRLAKGDFNAATIYETNPLRQAELFAKAGASWLHVVDLDGAKDGTARQTGIISAIAQASHLKVQAGGGIRTDADIQTLLDAGAARVVIGSLAVKDAALVQKWLEHYGPDKIVLALDVRLDENQCPKVLTHGWKNNSEINLFDLIENYKSAKLKTLLCTDVERDGMLTGSNHALYISLRKKFPELDILASGGIADTNELLQLHALGLKGTIIGKAIYEGRIDLPLALQRLQHAPVPMPVPELASAAQEAPVSTPTVLT